MKARKKATPRDTVPNSLIDDVEMHLDAMKTSAPVGEEKSFAKIPVDSIVKLRNPRSVPCTLEEFRKVEWVCLDLELSKSELAGRIAAAVAGHGWFEVLDDAGKDKAIRFFSNIHGLAVSIYASSQSQPVVLERESPASSVSFLVAGERRVLACIYSRGLIKTVDAVVWNRRLTKLEKAVFAHTENLKVGLTVAETLRATYDVWCALDDPSSLTLSELNGYWGYNSSSSPSILRRIFLREDAEDIISTVEKNKLGFRDLPALLDEAPSGSASTSRKTGRKRKVINPAVQEAERYGLKLSKPNQLKVASFVLDTLISSSGLPDAIREDLDSIDISSAEGLANAWNALARHAAEAVTDG